MKRLERFSELLGLCPDFLLDPDIDYIEHTVSEENVLRIRKSLTNFFECFKREVYNYDFQNCSDTMLQEITIITIEAKESCKDTIINSILDFFLKEIASLFEFTESETKSNVKFAEYVFMKKILRIQKILILLGFDPLLDIPIKEQTKLILYIGGSLDEVLADN